MSNEEYLSRTREASAALYEQAAEIFAEAPPGTRWTNAQICASVGFDSDADLASAALESQIAANVRDGVDRVYARQGLIMGFSKHVAMDKDLGEHHLKTGGDYLLNLHLNKMDQAMRANVAWTNNCGQLLEEHRDTFTRKQKMVMRFAGGMAGRLLRQMQSLAEANIPKMVKRYPEYQPLISLQQLVDDAATSIER